MLYQTINSIYDQLDDELIVYPGHDYLENNLKFTLSIEDNVHARQLLEARLIMISMRNPYLWPSKEKLIFF